MSSFIVVVQTCLNIIHSLNDVELAIHIAFLDDIIDTSQISLNFNELGWNDNFSTYSKIISHMKSMEVDLLQLYGFNTHMWQSFTIPYHTVEFEFVSTDKILSS